MSLGQAFIDVHANTTPFGPEVKAKVQEVLDKVIGKVLIEPKTTGFKTKLQTALNAIGAVKVNVEARSATAFRTGLQSQLDSKPIKVHVEAVGIAGLRSQLQGALQANPVKLTLHITQAEFTRIKNEIRTNLANLPPLILRFDAGAAIAQLHLLTAAVNQATAALNGLNGATHGVSASASDASNIIGGAFRSALDGAVNAASNLLKGVVALDTAIGAFGVKGTLELENLETALGGVIAGNQGLDFSKDLEKITSQVADQVEKIRKLGRLAPQFSFKGLTEAVVRMQTLGISGDAAVASVKNLSNALAAAGRASDTNLEGAITPILQAISTGKFLGQDLNQLAQRLPGIFNRGDVLKRLQFDLGLSKSKTAALTDEFQKLREQGLPAAETVKAVFASLNDSKVAKGALERQAKTIRGQIFTIRRTIEQGILDLFNDVREPLGQALAKFGPEVEKVFGKNGPLLKSIRDFVIEGVPIVASLINPVARAIAAVNQVILAAFRALGPEVGPIIDKISTGIEDFATKIVNAIPQAIAFVKQLAAEAQPIVGPLVRIGEALAIISVISIDALARGFGVLGQILEPVADTLKPIAELLFAIAQTKAGEILLTVAGSLAAIAIAGSAVGVLRGVAVALGLIAGGAGAASGGLTIFGASLGRVILVAGPMIAALAGINEGFKKLTGEGIFGGIGFGGTVKGLAADTADGLVNAAQGAANGITAAFNAIPGVDIDTSKFNEKMDGINDKLKGTSDRLDEVEQKKIDLQISFDKAEATRKQIQDIKDALDALPPVTDPVLKVEAQQAKATIADTIKGLDAIPDHKSTQYVVAAQQGLSTIGQVISDLGAIPGLTQSTVLVDIVRRFRTIFVNNGHNSGGSISLGPEQGTGFTISPEQQAKVAAEAEAAAFQRDIEKLVTKNAGGSGGGGGGGGSSAAADAAKRALENFREAIRRILDSLDQGFRDTLKNGTGKAIDNALDGLANSIKTAFKGRKTKVDDNLVTFLDKQNRKLQKLVIQRDKILKTLEAAQRRAEEVATATRSFASITAVEFEKAVEKVRLVTETLDIAGSFRVLSREVTAASDDATDKIKHSGAEYAKALRARLAAIKAFNANIALLIKEGVNKTTIDQIISAGVEGGAATADALAHASDKVRADINKTQAEIDKQATKLGNRAADSLFRAGTSVVDGLIAGLKDKKADVADAMGDIATELIKRIRKDLKIHSPSRVMRDLFRFAGHGAVLGLNDSVKGVAAASAGLARAAVPRMQTVRVGDLQAMAAADSVMQLRAAGASSGGVTPEHIDRVVAAVAAARPNKEIHAPIHQTFTSPVTPASAKMAFGTVARR